MPSLTVQGKSSTTITLLLNGSYNDYSFAKNGSDIGLEIEQQTADINSSDPNATTVTFKNLIPNTTYQFGIIDDNAETGEVMAGTTISVTTDASTEITDVPTEGPFTLSFVSSVVFKGTTIITVKINGNINDFVSGGYQFAINGAITPPITFSDETGEAAFTVDNPPVTFTVITSEGQVVPGSELTAPPASGGGGLSDGAIIGIIFGCIIGLWLIYYYSYVKYFKLA